MKIFLRRFQQEILWVFCQPYLSDLALKIILFNRIILINFSYMYHNIANIHMLLILTKCQWHEHNSIDGTLSIWFFFLRVWIFFIDSENRINLKCIAQLRLNFNQWRDKFLLNQIVLSSNECVCNYRHHGKHIHFSSMKIIICVCVQHSSLLSFNPTLHLLVKAENLFHPIQAHVFANSKSLNRYHYHD